ncbi:MAG: MBL fold metallo-hydrolase [Alphaproteobacteria bacterium]|nr:MBL fold metallo-hydrolase [Alphaproteobacteria bacterium]
MRVTLLGCGSSPGVPMIGCRCDVCTSENLRNRRTRASVHVEVKGQHLLIDTSPDLRQQALANGITRVDALFYTHAHADHTHGIDEMRSFNYLGNKAIPCFADTETLKELMSRFPYAFLPPVPEYGWFRPSLEPVEMFALKPVQVGPVTVLPLEQLHGRLRSYGFRIGNVAYSPDANALPEETLQALEGIDVWIVDCLRPRSSPTHASLEMAESWIARIKPKRAILTHMSHELEYDALAATLLDGVEPGYDGLVVEC